MIQPPPLRYNITGISTLISTVLLQRMSIILRDTAFTLVAAKLGGGEQGLITKVSGFCNPNLDDYFFCPSPLFVTSSFVVTMVNYKILFRLKFLLTLLDLSVIKFKGWNGLYGEKGGESESHGRVSDTVVLVKPRGKMCYHPSRLGFEISKTSLFAARPVSPRLR